MTEAEQVLQASTSVVVIDWPSRDVPNTLAGADYSVVVRGGAGPGDYSATALSRGLLEPEGHGVTVGARWRL